MDFESRLATLEKEVASLQQKLEDQRVAERIRRGLDQVDRGETFPALEALEEIRKKYNIQSR